MPRSTTQGRDSLEPEALTPDLAPVFRQFLYEHFRSWRADGSSPTPTLGAARADNSDVMVSFCLAHRISAARDDFDQCLVGFHYFYSHAHKAFL